MKEQIRVCDMIKNLNFEGFLIVKNAQQKTASTGSKYLDMTLTDATGEINAKRWDGLETAPNTGDVIKVRGIIQEFNGKLQLRIDKMRYSAVEDNVDMNTLTPCVTNEPDDISDGPVSNVNEQICICDMADTMEFQGLLLAKTVQVKVDKKNSEYLDMVLIDRTGEIYALCWNMPDEVPAAGDVVKVKGTIKEYHSKLQLKIDRINIVRDEFVDMNALIPCAPRHPEDMMDDILNRADQMQNKQLKELVLKMIDEAGEKLMLMPGAKNLHHAQRSGLLNHTTTMLKGAGFICELYPFLDSDLLAAGVILHDLCKIEEMNMDEMGLVTDYSMEGNLLGHIVMGVSKLDRCGRELGIDHELLIMLEHMLLAHHDLPEYGSPKSPMFPEAEVLHILDLLDARMFEMKNECEKVAPGTFTDRIWSLDRKLYRRTGKTE